MSLALKLKKEQTTADERVNGSVDLTPFVPKEVYPLDNPQTDLPRIAKDNKLIQLIEESVRQIPTAHLLQLVDARAMTALGRLCLWCLRHAREPEVLVDRLGAWVDLVRESGAPRTGLLRSC